MGAEQVSGSRTLVGEREERRERIIGDGEGSREGLREGVVWWAKERASSSRAEGGTEVQCETSRRARSTNLALTYSCKRSARASLERLHCRWGEVAVKPIRRGSVDSSLRMSKVEWEIEVLRVLRVRHPFLFRP